MSMYGENHYNIVISLQLKKKVLASPLCGPWGQFMDLTPQFKKWCLHWDDPEGWYGEGGGKGVQDWEHVYTRGRFMLMYGKTNTIL